MASLYRKPIVVRDPDTGERVKTKSKKWWGRYTDALGREKRVPLATDRRAAQAMLQELVQRVERQQAGLEDPAEEQMRRPIADHLADFETYLRARDVTDGHVSVTLTHVRKMIAAGRWRCVGDIDATSVTRFLGDLRARGRSAQTYNHYLKSIKHFARWLERERRIIRNPIAHMSRLNVKADCRHPRRALSTDEFQRLVTAAENGPPIEGISGPDRAMIYLIAAWTGFRKGEIGSLTVQSFDLDAEVPTATVAAAFSKRRREDSQILHPYLVEKLRKWLDTRGAVEPDELLFPISARAGVTVTRGDGTIFYRRHSATRLKKTGRKSLPAAPERKTHVMMYDDLAAARRVWIAEAEGDKKEHRRRQRSDFLAYCNHAGLYADFHSIRHTFITNLCKANISPKTAQTLARHSDIRLTMEVYTHVDREEQIDAIRKLRAPEDDAA